MDLGVLRWELLGYSYYFFFFSLMKELSTVTHLARILHHYRMLTTYIDIVLRLLPCNAGFSEWICC